MKRYRIAFGVAAVTAVATYGLIVLGGVVFNTGSSLACPDWPKCYGEWMPPMKGGVLYEHGHRILGALVGLGSLLLCGLLWKKDADQPSLRALGVAMPLLVIFQGVLGGLIVLWKLPMLVRAGHLATSMIVLMTLIFIARAAWVRARELAAPAALPLAATPGVRTALPLLSVTLALVYLQLILGALVRHTNSSEAAGWGLEHSMMGIDPLTGKYSLWPGDAAAQLNLFHRYVALIVAAVVILCCARCWPLLRERLSWRGKVLVWLPSLFVLTQLLVGVVMLATWNLKIYPALGISDDGAMAVQVTMRTLHLAVGTLILASLWLLTVTAGQAAQAPSATTAGGGMAQPLHGPA